VNELVSRVSSRALVALAIAVLAPLLELTGLHPPGRLLLAVAFTLLVPGVAVVEVLRLPSLHVSWCLAVALSLAVNILVAQLQLTLRIWHPLVGQLVIALVSLVLLVVAARFTTERPVPPVPAPAPVPVAAKHKPKPPSRRSGKR